MSSYTRRTFLSTGAAAGLAGAGALALPRFARAAGASDTINVGVVGCGGRGNELISQIKGVAGVRIVALCDPDSARTAATAKERELGGVKEFTDVRRLLDGGGVDAVAVATCNHWHCLASVWAVEAGKDVYCEKPLSHSLWEGRQLVAAAKKHDRIVQVGTQQRSDPLQAEVKDYLHEQQALGPIQSVVVARFGVRGTIGKRDAPLNPPDTVDYNLWLGPAQDEPIMRDKFHYDWHWSWNTGDGECGNWGVHLLDDVVNVVLLDKHKLPSRVASGGGRVAWNDAGESPNLHVAYLEAGDMPVLFALSNLPAAPGVNNGVKYNGVETGYVVVCEGGAYRGWRGRGQAVDSGGKVIREFRGDSGGGHMENFFTAVRDHDRSKLNAPVEVGHSSAGWAHVINAAVRAGTHEGLAPRGAEADNVAGCDELKEVIRRHVEAYDVDQSQCRASGMFEIDQETEEFAGENAKKANVILGKPDYREGFAIEI